MKQPLWWSVVVALALTLTAAPSAAFAHGVDEVAREADAFITFHPATPVAGEPFEVTLRAVALDGHPLAGATVEASFDRAKKVVAVPLEEAAPGVYAGKVTLGEKEWHAQFRLSLGETRLVTDLGFTVVNHAGDLGRKIVNLRANLRQAGLTQAPAWTDTATWVILFVAPLLIAAIAMRRRAATSADARPAAARDLVPAGLLGLAVLGGLAQPFSGYWDIAWHINQGRDGLLSPPHLGIYAGIILGLAVLSVGALRNGGLTALTRFPALLVAMVAMIVQLSSAPLDELWHRLMGLDISVWAPPHLMLIFGAGLSMLGLAAIQAAANPDGRSEGGYLRLMGFIAASFAIMHPFLAEFEFNIPAWHISQARPHALYPATLALAGALTLVAGVRLAGRRTFTATKVAAFVWLFRAAEVWLYLPAIRLPVPKPPTLAIVLAALLVDLLVQGGLFFGPRKYAMAGLAYAVGVFAFYAPAAGILPQPVVTPAELLTWFPLAAVTSAAAGYLAGRLGDYVLGPEAETQALGRFASSLR